MIVLQSTYDAKCFESAYYQDKYSALVKRWNDLVLRYNKLISEPKPDVQFTQEDITKLIQLCHPDKHGGKSISTELTQKLLKLRK